MSRIVIPQIGKKSSLRIIHKNSLLAFFNFVDTETGLEYKDWKLMAGKHGNFVGSPCAPSYENKEGRTIYPPYIQPAYDPETESKRNAKGEEFCKAILLVAQAEYDKLSGGSVSDRPAPKRSGAGPTRKTENSSSLPF